MAKNYAHASTPASDKRARIVKKLKKFHQDFLNEKRTLDEEVIKASAQKLVLERIKLNKKLGNFPISWPEVGVHPNNVSAYLDPIEKEIKDAKKAKISTTPSYA